MVKTLVATLTLLLVLSVSACSGPALVTSPIAEPAGAPYDERLVGIWHAYARQHPNWNEHASDDEEEFVTLTLIIDKASDGGLEVTYDQISTNSSADLSPVRNWGRWRAHASIIDDRVYYSGQLADAQEDLYGDPDGPGDDRLSLSFYDFIPASDAIYQLAWVEITTEGNLVLHVMHAEDLRGLGLSVREIDLGSCCGSIRVFEISSERLAALIRDTDPEKLFTARLGPFERVDRSSANPVDVTVPFGGALAK